MSRHFKHNAYPKGYLKTPTQQHQSNSTMLSTQASVFVPRNGFGREVTPAAKSRVPSRVQWSNRSMPKIYNPPPSGYLRVLELENTDHIAMVIGKNGAVFNAITHQTRGLTYIWYDRIGKRIEIWGDTTSSVSDGYDKVMDRVRMVRSMNSPIEKAC